MWKMSYLDGLIRVMFLAKLHDIIARENSSFSHRNQIQMSAVFWIITNCNGLIERSLKHKIKLKWKIRFNPQNKRIYKLLSIRNIWKWRKIGSLCCVTNWFDTLSCSNTKLSENSVHISCYPLQRSSKHWCSHRS